MSHDRRFAAFLRLGRHPLCLAVLIALVATPSAAAAGPTSITSVSREAGTHAIHVALNAWPGTWPGWKLYVDGTEMPMEGAAGEPVVRPDADLARPPTGLYVGTTPWLSGLGNVNFPCCGTVQFDIPGQGLTNEFAFNLRSAGCTTASVKACPLDGPHEVGGSISEDTTWSGEVLVTSSVTVEAGAVLTVLPGTHVRFQHYRGYREPERRLRLRVLGGLVAQGTAAAPIYFTSDAADPQNGDWSMIRLLTPSGPTVFDYCVFEFAQQGLNAWQASPTIRHSVFRWNNWEGVYFESFCQPTLEYCQIYQNGYNGLAAEQSNSVFMDYCDVWSNGTSGVHIDNSVGEVRRSLVHDNGAIGLSVDDSGTLLAMGDAIYGNHDCGIGAGEGSNTITISNTDVYHNGGYICGTYSTIASAYYAPTSISPGFVPDQTHALGYTPGDQTLDGYPYVYPDDETRRIARRIGTGLGLTWALAWDGQYVWTCTLWGHVYKLDPVTGAVLDDFVLSGSSQWGTPTQVWGMAFDDDGYMWLLDFAERKLFCVDPVTHGILLSFDSPNAAAGGCKGLAWDGTYLDVAGWVSPAIYRMTRTGVVAETIGLQGGGAGGLAWDGEHFWVPGSGRILKYDLLGHQVGWIYAASEGTWDMAWDGAFLWASQRTNENWPDAKVFALEVLEDHDYSAYMPWVLAAPG